MAKQLMYRSLEQTMEARQQAARRCFQLNCETEDVQEGLVSFFESRKPLWKGKHLSPYVPIQRTILKARGLSWKRECLCLRGNRNSYDCFSGPR